MARFQHKTNRTSPAQPQLHGLKRRHIGVVGTNRNRQTNPPISRTFLTEASIVAGITTCTSPNSKCVESASRGSKMNDEPEPMTTDPNDVDDPEPADPHQGPLDNPDDERFLDPGDPRRQRKILHPDETDDPPDAG